MLVKAHARVAPGKCSTDPSDFAKEKTVYAMRDIDILARAASTADLSRASPKP